MGRDTENLIDKKLREYGIENRQLVCELALIFTNKILEELKRLESL